MDKSQLRSIGAFARQAIGGTRANSWPTIIAFVTSRCNARCDFCLYHSQVNNPIARESELTPGEYEKIATRLGQVNYLGLSGGEPFVRDDIDQIVSAFAANADLRVVDIPSNFYFRDRMIDAVEHLSRKHPGLRIELQFSVDDLGPAHDKSRKVDGLFERAIDTFKALEGLRDRHPNVILKVNVVWLPENRQRLAEIKDQLGRQLNWDRFSLTWPHFPVRSFGPTVPPKPDDVAAFAQTAKRLNGGPNYRSVGRLYAAAAVSLHRVYHRLLQQAADKQKPVGNYCDAGRSIVVIGENGEVYPCEPLFEAVGNLRDFDYDLASVTRAAAATSFRQQHLGNCDCGWGCAMLSHASKNPAFLPEVALRSLVHLATHPSSG